MKGVCEEPLELQIAKHRVRCQDDKFRSPAIEGLFAVGKGGNSLGVDAFQAQEGGTAGNSRDNAPHKPETNFPAASQVLMSFCRASAKFGNLFSGQDST